MKCTYNIWYINNLMASRLDHWITVHSFRKSTLNTSFTQIKVLLKFSSWPLLVVIQNISTGTWPLYKVTCLKSTSRASHNPQGCAWYINIYWQRNLVLLLSIDWSINCLLVISYLIPLFASAEINLWLWYDITNHYWHLRVSYLLYSNLL